MAGKTCPVISSFIFACSSFRTRGVQGRKLSMQWWNRAVI